jgi:glycosyltransferase involved in cell wall biosynthesis
MPQIIFDCERMKYPDTGLYHYCLNLGLHLKDELRTKEEELVYYAPNQYHGLFGDNSAYVSQHPLHKFRLPETKDYAIWHATYQNTQYLPFRNRKIKVVLSIHDLNFIHDDNKSPAKKLKYLAHLQQLINRADALVCVSDYSKQDVLQFCNTHNKPLYVVYNGTNTCNLPALTRSSYQPKKPFLFSIGVVNRKKNYHVLLPLLKNNNMELVIAGKHDDARYVNYIKDCSAEMGVSEKLSLLGPVSENEKAWYYHNCRAFAMPSIAEGFGLPVAEAMNYGKPLFLSDLTALPEIGGDVSFYFKNFKPDHMQSVFASGMEKYNANGLKDRIKARGARFCWQKAAAAYAEIYRSLY